MQTGRRAASSTSSGLGAEGVHLHRRGEGPWAQRAGWGRLSWGTAELGNRRLQTLLCKAPTKRHRQSLPLQPASGRGEGKPGSQTEGAGHTDTQQKPRVGRAQGALPCCSHAAFRGRGAFVVILPPCRS